MLKNWMIKILAGRPAWLWNYLGLSFYCEPWQRGLYDQQFWLLAQIRRLRPRSILEPGCGFGRNLKFLLENGFKPNQLSGVDFSRTQLVQARKKLPAQVKLVRADILRLPFKQNSFDLVFTHGLLMHLKPEHLSAALAELARVTRKYLILIEEVGFSPGRLNGFTWAHDYDKIIARAPLKLIKRQNQPNHIRCYLLQK